MVDQRNPDDTMRWVRRGSVLAVLLIGWTFILVTNHFRLTPPTVFACLGYFAAVIAIYTLFRTGATAVTDTDESDDALSWTQPLGAIDELEREKRALLKAIKEAEFDHEMGKLSKADADSMIGLYRNRAIEVIKAMEVQAASGETGSVRDRILREARARIEIETRSREAPAAGKKRKSKGEVKAEKLAEAVAAAKQEAVEPASEHKTYEATPETTLGDVLEGKLVEVKPTSEAVDAKPESEIPVETEAEPAESKEAAR